MIGNDIVDLNQARQESNWRRKGFLDKLFTPDEQQLIHSATDPDVLVWTLWSMKESAYKLIVRETNQRFFAPQKLVCYISKSCSGILEGSVFYQKLYATRSLITTRYVASIAFLPGMVQPFEHEIITFAHIDYQYQHEHIRARIKQHYATRFSMPESSIQIRKNELGIPTLLSSNNSGRIIKAPISLSHHGHYGAFVSA